VSDTKYTKATGIYNKGPGRIGDRTIKEKFNRQRPCHNTDRNIGTTCLCYKENLFLAITVTWRTYQKLRTSTRITSWQSKYKFLTRRILCLWNKKPVFIISYIRDITEAHSFTLFAWGQRQSLSVKCRVFKMVHFIRKRTKLIWSTIIIIVIVIIRYTALWILNYTVPRTHQAYNNIVSPHDPSQCLNGCKIRRA
jgi:hypothetical protein